MEKHTMKDGTILLSGLSPLVVCRQWVTSSMPSNKTYDTVSFPISFKSNVYQIIPVDWDSGNLSIARGYTFMILSAGVTLTNANIVTNESVGFYKVLIIGV